MRALFYLVGRLAPSAKYLPRGRRGWPGGPGRSCRAPGAEVWAKLGQLAGRHFNCGFQPARDPPRPGWEVGGRAFGFRLAFSRLSPSLLPSFLEPAVDSSWAGSRTAGVIPPGRGRLLARRLAAHRRAQGASGQYWILNVRSGGISPPAVPGIRGCLLRRFPVCRRPLESQSRAQLLGDELLVQDLGTKSLPPGVATPLNSAFQRLAEARCWRAAKGGDELFFEGGKSPQTPASLCRDSKGSLFASPGRWVPSIAQRAKGVK